MKEPKRIPHEHYAVPNRCWFVTRDAPDGSPMWGSREWEPGEVAELLRSEAFTKPKSE